MWRIEDLGARGAPVAFLEDEGAGAEGVADLLLRKFIPHTGQPGTFKVLIFSSFMVFSFK